MNQTTTDQLKTSKRRASRTINKDTTYKGKHSRWNVESKGCLIWERTCQTGKKREKKETREPGFSSSGHIRTSTQTNTTTHLYSI